MSRGSARSRPTRDETRERLFHAAAEVFEAQGIAASSIEDIVAAAGFTRGAFYSNFSSKDDLVLAMLDDHLDRATQEIAELQATVLDPWEFIAQVGLPGRRADWPLGRSYLLHTEFVLWALRDPTNRPRMAERMRANRAAISRVIETTMARLGRQPPMDLALGAEIIMALDDGIAIHRLIDPDEYDDHTFGEIVGALQDLFVRATPLESEITNDRDARPGRRDGGRAS